MQFIKMCFKKFLQFIAYPFAKAYDGIGYLMAPLVAQLKFSRPVVWSSKAITQTLLCGVLFIMTLVGACLLMSITIVALTHLFAMFLPLLAANLLASVAMLGLTWCVAETVYEMSAEEIVVEVEIACE